MTETKKTFTQFLDKLKSDKKSLFTVILGLAGILLILLSEIPSMHDTEKIQESNEKSYADSELCRDVEKLISQIKGAGDVSVMLTYENTGEKIFAKDSDIENTSDNESQTSHKYIIIDSNQGENGLVIKELYPEIRGVAVVCSGGDDPTVRGAISSLLSALFDIGSNRISIAPRAEKE